MKRIHFILLLLLSAFPVSCQTNPGVPRTTASSGLRSLTGKHIQFKMDMWVIPESMEPFVGIPERKRVGYTGLPYWLHPRSASPAFESPPAEPASNLNWAWTDRKTKFKILDFREMTVVSPDTWIYVYLDIPGQTGPVAASPMLVPKQQAKAMGIDTTGLSGTQVAEKVLMRRDNVLWRRLD